MSRRDRILVETEPTHTHPMSRRDMIWDVGYWLLAVLLFAVGFLLFAVGFF